MIWVESFPVNRKQTNVFDNNCLASETVKTFPATNERKVCRIWFHLLLIFFVIGLFGSVREDYCSLMSFAVALGIVIALELSLGVSAFALAKQNRLSAKIAEKMRVSLEIYDQPDHEGVTKGNPTSPHSQFWSFKIRRMMFPNNIRFVEPQI